jgi:RNA polymerase sigma-70 factor, ECF subfamily
MDERLVAVFHGHAGHRHAGASFGDAALGQSLAEIVAEARAAWPGIEIDAADFVAHLATRWSAVDVVRKEGSRGPLRASDLYLACACALGDARAIALFEETYIAGVDRALARLRLPAAAIDETKQRLRARLLVPRGHAAGHIADYLGTGDLAAWVRAAAIRVALRVIEQPEAHVETDSAVLRAVAAPEQDLELEYLKRRYTADLEAALREAFVALPVRDRNLLRYYYAKNLGIDGVAVVYHVHRATAARQIRRATERLSESAREVLASSLKTDRREISSMLRLIQSRITAAFQRALAERREPSRS